jgi:hypothetical protein
MIASDSDIKGYCWHCARGLIKADYGREALCLGCGKATRVCRNCRFFAPGRPNACSEPMAERVADKQKANFCEFFDPNPNPSSSSSSPGGNAAAEAQADLRQAAEALFR